MLQGAERNYKTTRMTGRHFFGDFFVRVSPGLTAAECDQFASELKRVATVLVFKTFLGSSAGGF
jgi:hypothetical protein